jgi:hypothetical protein
VIADFHDLLSAFVTGGVRFLIVGAHALAAHGVPRATGDLDVWVEPTPENARLVWLALEQFGAPLADLGIREADLTIPDQVVQLGLPPYRIDVMTSISGVAFGAAWVERMEGSLFEVPVAFIGRSMFIKNKRASGRLQDLADIDYLGGE